MAWNSELLAHQIGNVGSRLFGIPTEQDRQRQQQEEAAAALSSQLPPGDPRSSILQSALQGAVGTDQWKSMFPNAMQVGMALNAPKEQPQPTDKVRNFQWVMQNFPEDQWPEIMRMLDQYKSPTEIDIHGQVLTPKTREVLFLAGRPDLANRLTEQQILEANERVDEYRRTNAIDEATAQRLLEHRLTREAHYNSLSKNSIYDDVEDELTKNALLSIDSGEIDQLIHEAVWMDDIVTNKLDELSGIYGGGNLTRRWHEGMERMGAYDDRQDLRVQINTFLAGMNLDALERMTGNPTDKDAEIAKDASTRLANFKLSPREAEYEFKRLREAYSNLVRKALAKARKSGAPSAMISSYDRMEARLP